MDLIIADTVTTTTTTTTTSRVINTITTSGEKTIPRGDRGAVIESDVVFWSIIDGILLIAILGGNTLTILAVRFSRRLRSAISNQFVLSLAISDMVVGFTLPYHLAFYMGSGLGDYRFWCLLRFFLIIFACCVSIWNLIAIAVDRYLAIVYPLHYSRYMNNKVALILLSFGWVLGFSIASVPLFWNNWDTATECEFIEVLNPWYMAGVITPIFSMVWLCMFIVYCRIWREASKHAKQLRTSFTGLQQEGPSDWKSVQVVLLILGCFSICWLPYFIIACAQIFKLLEEESSPTLYKGAFSLAMANSGMNPIIYAWKNSNFRRAFSQLLRCRSPDAISDDATAAISHHSLRSNLHRKSSSIIQQQQQQYQQQIQQDDNIIIGNDNSDNINNFNISFTTPPLIGNRDSRRRLPTMQLPQSPLTRKNNNSNNIHTIDDIITPSSISATTETTSSNTLVATATITPTPVTQNTKTIINENTNNIKQINNKLMKKQISLDNIKNNQISNNNNNNSNNNDISNNNNTSIKKLKTSTSHNLQHQLQQHEDNNVLPTGNLIINKFAIIEGLLEEHKQQQQQLQNNYKLNNILLSTTTVATTITPTLQTITTPTTAKINGTAVTVAIINNNYNYNTNNKIHSNNFNYINNNNNNFFECNNSSGNGSKSDNNIFNKFDS